MQRSQRLTQTTPRPWPRIVLLAVFVIAAGITAYLTFTGVRDLVASWEITGLPGMTIRDATPTPGTESGSQAEAALPVVAADPSLGPKPVPWDGASRVTLLIMGLDYRDWESGQGAAPLTDTMMLLTIDPLTKTAGMLSIPRDLWVGIPGRGYARINTAYKNGEIFKYPDGGGPGLAMATVEGLLGVPVDYYAIIEFGAFIRFIDEIGGVKIDIPEKIQVDPLGDNNTKTLKPGRQVLPGDLALAYVRARKGAGDDFGRAQRQQQVVLGIRDRILDFNQLPSLISRSGALYEDLSSGIHTNLNLDDSIKLAWLGAQIPKENIKQGAIAPPKMVFPASVETEEGTQEVLKPITEEIRVLRDEIFTSSGAIGPVDPNADLAELVKAEGARVSVLNGTGTPNLASLTSEYLTGLGVNVTETGNAAQGASLTTITFYTAKPYAVKFLFETLNVQEYAIRYESNPSSPVDVTVTLGNDWAANNSMGQ